MGHEQGFLVHKFTLFRAFQTSFSDSDVYLNPTRLAGTKCYADDEYHNIICIEFTSPQNKHIAALTAFDHVTIKTKKIFKRCV